MLTLGPPGRVFLHRAPTDLRKSFDGLGGLVRTALGQEPLGGDWFVFLNRRRDLVKVLYWDRDGFALWAKRLERGRFVLPGGSGAEVDRAALSLLLEGVCAQIVSRSPRWHPKN